MDKLINIVPITKIFLAIIKENFHQEQIPFFNFNSHISL